MAGNALRKNEERRSYRRVSDAVALAVVRLEEHGGDEQSHPVTDELPNHPTHVISLSPNGLKCYHPEPYDEGDKVLLGIKLFPEETTLEIEATVVNAGEESDPGKKDRFYAGMAFSSATDEQRQILLDHLDRVARNSFGGAVKLVNK